MAFGAICGDPWRFTAGAQCQAVRGQEAVDTLPGLPSQFRKKFIEPLAFKAVQTPVWSSPLQKISRISKFRLPASYLGILSSVFHLKLLLFWSAEPGNLKFGPSFALQHVTVDWKRLK